MNSFHGEAVGPDQEDWQLSAPAVTSLSNLR
jgi:hypothetical protein